MDVPSASVRDVLALPLRAQLLIRQAHSAGCVTEVAP
jgi:hypothetical protein